MAELFFFSKIKKYKNKKKRKSSPFIFIFFTTESPFGFLASFLHITMALILQQRLTAERRYLPSF